MKKVTNQHNSYYEIGYWLEVDYQGQGLIIEAVNALTRYALQALKTIRVQIATQAENSKCIAVAQRCGFVLEAKLKRNCIDCVTGFPADSLLFACCELSALPPLEVKWKHRA